MSINIVQVGHQLLTQVIWRGPVSVRGANGQAEMKKFIPFWLLPSAQSLYITLRRVYTGVGVSLLLPLVIGVFVLSCVQLFVTPWTIAHHAPLSMAFFRQEYWGGLPFPLAGIFLTQGLNPCLLCLLYWQADPLPLSHLGSPVYGAHWHKEYVESSMPVDK